MYSYSEWVSLSSTKIRMPAELAKVCRQQRAACVDGGDHYNPNSRTPNLEDHRSCDPSRAGIRAQTGQRRQQLVMEIATGVHPWTLG